MLHTALLENSWTVMIIFCLALQQYFSVLSSVSALFLLLIQISRFGRTW